MCDAAEQEFLEYVQSGGQVETGDWMPDDYRAKLIKFIEMHGNSELMGVLPEREWILRAPTLQRKLALTAKVQDEVGHAQLIYRVVEDLGKPREACLDDLISGKAKFHNVFHYPTKTWGDVGVIAWLVDAAAIISQKALLKCSYAPYARIMKKICWEESFHILHGRDVVLTMMLGTDEQRELVQEALDRWWGPLMHFHGNPIPADDDPMVVWRIKSQANEEARQQFLDGYVPQIWELGLTVPDPRCARTRTASGSTPSPTGTSCARSSPATARARRSGSTSAASPARTPRGCGRSCSPKQRDLRGLPAGAEGQAFQHAGSFEAPDGPSRRRTRRSSTAGAASRRRSGSCRATAIQEVDEFVDELNRNYHRVDGYSLKTKLREARERAGTAAPARSPTTS